MSFIFIDFLLFIVSKSIYFDQWSFSGLFDQPLLKALWVNSCFENVRYK